MKEFSIVILSILGLLSLEAQYISEVLDYRPAPGQFINEAPWGVPSARQSLVGGISGHMSLGFFGGSVVFRFAEPVENHEDNPYGVDFTIYGNPMSEWSEPGAVWVMPDNNGNELPDEDWYELAGSDYWFSSSRLARVNYENPGGEEASDVSWEDEQGNSGKIYANSVHTQNYYPHQDSFPDIAADSYNVKGRLIRGKVDLKHPPLIKSQKRAFGYADNQARGSASDLLPDNPYTPDVENGGGDAFDLDWAVDSAGNRVELDHILFVKVQTALLHEGGYLGEVSTEISGAVDVAPDPTVDDGPDRILVLADLPDKCMRDTLQLEAFCFEKGYPVELPELLWTTSVGWAEVDEHMRLILKGEGEVEISVQLVAEPELTASSYTTVVAVEPLELFSPLAASEPVFYPNPATDRIHLNDEAFVSIYDLAGSLLLRALVPTGGGTVECGDLVPGVYVLLIRDEESIGTHKLVIY